jgi:hypothetical protein
MNAQEFRSLQEAYLEVIEGKVSWNDPKNPNPSGYTPKEKSEAKRKQLGVDNPDTKSFEKGGPGEKEYARHGNLSATQKKMEKRGNQPKGKKHEFKKNPFWKKDAGQVRRELMGTNVPKSKESSYPSSVAKSESRKEEVDIYDIILSHLLDEGYAETPEAAQVIMVNMSEEWREEIVEEVLDEELTGARKQKASDMLDRKLRDVETLRRLSARKRQKPEDVGSGNKARRRAGKEVKDSTLGISDG